MVIMKPRLFNQESKMRLINQQLYKKAKLDLKKIRIQQQQQQPTINITINNTGFEKKRRINETYRNLELVSPQERSPQERRPPERLLPETETEASRRRTDEYIRSVMGDTYSSDSDDGESFIDSDSEDIPSEMDIRKAVVDVKEIQERETMGKEDITPRELRLQSALKREKLFYQAQGKEIRDVRLQRALNKYEEAVEKTKKIKEKNLFLFG